MEKIAGTKARIQTSQGSLFNILVEGNGPGGGGGGGEGDSLTITLRVCAAQRGRIFRTLI